MDMKLADQKIIFGTKFCKKSLVDPAKTASQLDDAVFYMLLVEYLFPGMIYNI